MSSRFKVYPENERIVNFSVRFGEYLELDSFYLDLLEKIIPKSAWRELNSYHIRGIIIPLVRDLGNVFLYYNNRWYYQEGGGYTNFKDYCSQFHSFHYPTEMEWIAWDTCGYLFSKKQITRFKYWEHYLDLNRIQRELKKCLHGVRKKRCQK